VLSTGVASAAAMDQQIADTTAAIAPMIWIVVISASSPSEPPSIIGLRPRPVVRSQRQRSLQVISRERNIVPARGQAKFRVIGRGPRLSSSTMDLVFVAGDLTVQQANFCMLAPSASDADTSTEPRPT
jgi:hypothetical protein